MDFEGNILLFFRKMSASKEGADYKLQKEKPFFYLTNRQYLRSHEVSGGMGIFGTKIFRIF